MATPDHSDDRATPVGRLLRPRSIAIVGVSPDARSFGAAALANLRNFNYAGSLHLVSRGRTEVLGQPCVSTIDDLPEAIDAAVLCLPQAAIIEALEACGRRRVGGAVVFASGFAETGAAGLAEQERLARVARAGGVAMLGPNCMGLTNFVDGIPLRLGPAHPAAADSKPAVGLIAQSGAMMSAIRDAIAAKGIGLTHVISTGNEAVVGVEDFLAELIEDASTRVIALFVEHIGRPQLFLKLAARSRAQGKPIVLFHSGRSSAAQESATSHTGALAGDYATMKALVEHEAVVLVESFDELVDVAAMLGRCPVAPTKGVGVVTNSGAFRGIAFDLCETIRLDVPKLSPPISDQLRGMLPSFVGVENPLDLATQLMRDPDLLGASSEVILRDDRIGSLVVSVVPGTSAQACEKARAAVPVLRDAEKPVAFAVIGGDAPLPPEFFAQFQESGVPLFLSPDRALRAMAHLTAYGRSLEAWEARKFPVDVAPVRLTETGTIPEYRGKELLRQIGVPVPEGALARNLEEACEVARRIGFPVALKAQAKELAHKSDVGGVALDLRDEASLCEAWDRLQASVASTCPGLRLDGVLVEQMSRHGIEMVVGAKRDPKWGPVVMIGLGGIWIEAFADVRLLPPTMTEDEIVAAIGTLRAAKVLRGTRGQPAADVRALAAVVASIAALMRAMPQISEIDLNPVMVYPEGQGVQALDALMVVA